MKYYQVLTEIESKMNQSKDADELLRLKKQERAGFATLLRETCKSTRIVLEANSLVGGLRAQFTPASQLNAKKELQRMETEKLMKEISKMMQNGATPTPTAAPNPALDFTRVRYISANCNASIGYARTRRPDYSGADCYYYGFYTPQCTGARRKEIKLMLSAPPRAGASAPAVEVQQGLEEF